MTSIDRLPRNKSLPIDTLEDVNNSFHQIITRNHLPQLLEASDDDKEIIQSAYKNLGFVNDVYEKFGDKLPEDKQAQLQDLIREDAHTLIAARLPSDEYIQQSLIYQHPTSAGLATAPMHMRELIPLVKAWEHTDQDPAIKQGIVALASELPRHNTQLLFDAMNEARTSDLGFETIYEQLSKKRHMGPVQFIEHIGQRALLSPSEIKQGEERGDILDPSRKERNLVRSDGSTPSIVGNLAIKLSKRFRS